LNHFVDLNIIFFFPNPSHTHTYVYEHCHLLFPHSVIISKSCIVAKSTTLCQVVLYAHQQVGEIGCYGNVVTF